MTSFMSSRLHLLPTRRLSGQFSSACLRTNLNTGGIPHQPTPHIHPITLQTHRTSIERYSIGPCMVWRRYLHATSGVMHDVIHHPNSALNSSSSLSAAPTSQPQSRNKREVKIIIKHLHALRIDRSIREDTREVVLFGRTMVEEYLKQGRPVHHLYVTPGCLLEEARLTHERKVVEQQKANLTTTSAVYAPLPQPILLQHADLERVSGVESTPHETCAIVVPLPELSRTPTASSFRQHSRILVLDNVSDPGNVGTLFRSARAFDFDFVVLVDGCDPMNDKVIRASMGACMQLRLWKGNENKFISQFHSLMGQANVGICDAKTDGAVTLPNWKLRPGPIFLVIGNEAHGVRSSFYSLTSMARIHLPMNPLVESLNASVAGSIMMQHIYAGSPVPSAVAYPPSPKDLTTEGIEPNPGPPVDLTADMTNHTSSTVWTTISTDWLREITHYLDFTDLVLRFGRTCRYWLQVLETIPSRSRSFEYYRAGDYSTVGARIESNYFDEFLATPYRRHFNQLDFLYHIADDDLLNRLGQEAPHIQSYQHLQIVCGHERYDRLATEPNYRIYFPDSLQFLNIAFLNEREIIYRCDGTLDEAGREQYWTGVIHVLMDYVGQLNHLTHLELYFSDNLIAMDVFHHLPQSIHTITLHASEWDQLQPEHFLSLRTLSRLTDCSFGFAILSVEHLKAFTTPESEPLPLTHFMAHFIRQSSVELVCRLKALQNLSLHLSSRYFSDLSFLGELPDLNFLQINCEPIQSRPCTFEALLTAFRALHHRQQRYELDLSHSELSSHQLKELLPFLTYVQTITMSDLSVACDPLEFLVNEPPRVDNAPTLVYELTQFDFTSNSFRVTKPYSRILSRTHFPYLNEINIRGIEGLYLTWSESTSTFLLDLSLRNQSISHEHLLSLTIPNPIVQLFFFDGTFDDQSALELVGRFQSLERCCLTLSTMNVTDLSFLGELLVLESLRLNCSDEVSLSTLLSGFKSLRDHCHRFNDLDFYHPDLSSTQLTEFIPYIYHIPSVDLSTRRCESFEFLLLPTTSTTTIVHWRRFRFRLFGSDSFQVTRPYSQLFSHTHYPHLEEVIIDGENELHFNWSDEIINPQSEHFRSDLWPNLHTFQIELPKEDQVAYSSSPKDLTTEGIEPNPGPLESGDSPARANPTSRLTPQSLFKDGILIIYSYLSTHDWLACMYTCHAWHTAGHTQPSRALTISYDSPPPPAYFRHHFVRLNQPPTRSHRCLTGDELLTMMSHFSHLTQIDQCLLSSDTTNERFETLQWPQLTELCLQLPPTPCPHILKAFHNQPLPNLRELALTGICDCHLRDLTGLQDCHSLTWWDADMTQVSDHIFVNHTTQPWTHLPAQLVSLNLSAGRRSQFNFLVSLPPLVNLRYLHLSELEFQPGDLNRLFTFAPNLMSLAPSLFCSSDLHTIKLFLNLHSIYFDHLLKLHLPGLPLAHVIFSSLFISTNITSLYFNTFNSVSTHSWLILSEAVPNLTKLEFDWLFEDTMGSFRLALTTETFKSLEQLIISGNYSPPFMDHLDNRAICPKLVYFLNGSKKEDLFFEYDSEAAINTDIYRLVTHETVESSPSILTQERIEPHPTAAAPQETPPTARLVGVELNPGPSGSLDAPGSRSTKLIFAPNQFFKDGLHTILSFLSFKDALPVLHTSHSWYVGGQLEPCRRIRFDDYMSMERYHRILLSPLKFHIVQIHLSLMPQNAMLTLNQLNEVMEQFPFLDSFHSRIDPRPQPLKRPLQLNRHLTQLNLYFPPRTPFNGPGLDDTLPQAISTSCPKLTNLVLTWLPPWMDLTPLIQLTSLLDVAIAHARETSPQTRISQMKTISQIPNLTHLHSTIEEGILSNVHLIIQEQIIFPHVKGFFSTHSFKPGQLLALRPYLPELVELVPSGWYDGDLHHLSQYPYLTSIGLRDEPFAGTSFSVYDESQVLDGLIQCTHLRELRFQGWLLREDRNWLAFNSASWLTLFTHLPLISLTFVETCARSLLEILTNHALICTQLEKLELTRTFLPNPSMTLLERLVVCDSLKLTNAFNSPQQHHPRHWQDEVCMGENFLLAYNYLNDSHRLPKLHHLILHYQTSDSYVTKSRKFEFDLDQRINHNIYRVPLSTQPDPASTTNREQGGPVPPPLIHLTTQSSKPNPTTNRDAPPTVAPSPRLVGVELNPGPLDQLFNDGVDSIYAFLDMTSWLSAGMTCQRLQSIALTGRCRNLSLTINSVSMSGDQNRAKIRHEQLSSSPLIRRHMTQLECRDPQTLTQLNQFYDDYPALTNLHCSLEQKRVFVPPPPQLVDEDSDIWDLIDPPRTTIKRLDLSVDIRLSPALTTLAFALYTISGPLTYASLIRGLCGDGSDDHRPLPLCSKIELFGLPSHFDLTPLQWLPSLSSLNLWFDFKKVAHLNFSTIILPALAACTSLTSLGLFRETIRIEEDASVQLNDLSLPHLRHLTVDCDLPQTAFEALSRIAPNLVSLDCLDVDELHLPSVMRFQHLTTLKLKDEWLTEEEDALIQLPPLLTHLGLKRTIFPTSDVWTRLIPSLPHLTHLTLIECTFTHDKPPPLLIQQIRRLDIQQVSREDEDTKLMMGVLAQLTRVESFTLTFTSWAYSSVDELIRLFDDADLLPELTECTFSIWQKIWSWKASGSFMNNYRQSKSPTTVPPAAPFVGIESNPGPINPNSPSLNTPAKCMVAVELNPAASDPLIATMATSQLLFKDGLHITYSFLPLLDWLNCMSTCHHWHSAVRSQPSRQLTWSYYHRASIPSLTDQPLNSSAAYSPLPSQSLSRHFTQLSLPRPRNGSLVHVNMSGDQLFLLMDHLPCLNTILDCSVIVDASELASCQWASHLTSIDIYVHFHQQYPNLWASMLQQLSHSLTSLTIEGLPRNLDGILTGIQDLDSLTQLTLNDRGGPIDFLSGQWSHFPITLTHLNISRGHADVIPYLHLLPPLPGLTYWALQLVRVNDLSRIHAFAPNLTRCSPEVSFVMKELPKLKLFRSLQTIDFNRQPDGHGLDMESDRALIAALAECPSVTALGFGSWVCFQPAGWCELSLAVPNLKSLKLDFLRGRMTKDLTTSLTPTTFLNLERLIACCGQNHEDLKCLGTRKGVFVYDQVNQVNTDNYRLASGLDGSGEYPPPPKDLTTEGIEPNPGPPLNHLTTTFQSGVHLVARHPYYALFGLVSTLTLSVLSWQYYRKYLFQPNSARYQLQADRNGRMQFIIKPKQISPTSSYLSRNSSSSSAPSSFPSSRPNLRRVVCTVHGYLGIPRSFIFFRRPLTKAGYDEVIDYAYDSGDRLEDIADGLNERLYQAIQAFRPGQEIQFDFICHSNGGIVLRAALNSGHWPIPIPTRNNNPNLNSERISIGRIVMIATPNQGSEYARRITRFAPIKKIVLWFAKLQIPGGSLLRGIVPRTLVHRPPDSSLPTIGVHELHSCGDLLMTHSPDWFRTHLPLPRSLYPRTLVIAGTMSLLHGLGPQTTDGTIAFGETKLPPPLSTGDEEDENESSVESDGGGANSPSSSSVVSFGPCGSQHISFHAQHSFLLMHPGVIRATIRFLQTGHVE